jgi:hypothetical protein
VNQYSLFTAAASMYVFVQAEYLDGGKAWLAFNDGSDGEMKTCANA